jgi:hypothetical protein
MAEHLWRTGRNSGIIRCAYRKVAKITEEPPMTALVALLFALTIGLCGALLAATRPPTRRG